MCHPSWEKNICVVHVFVLFSVETIRLHVFDSPADLQNMLHDEMSLVDDLTEIYLKNTMNCVVLLQDLNQMTKKGRGQIQQQYRTTNNTKRVHKIATSYTHVV